MGVWHISGLGINPGAATVPMTYVYLLLKQASKGDRNAKEFFGSSKGSPEALIIFTSKEVTDGKAHGEIKDDWFQTHRKKSAPETIKAYLSQLLDELKNDKFTKFYGQLWLKYFYCIEVNHEDFEDCFFKTAITVNALKDHEIWINMTGGTNQINAALLSSSGFTSAAGVYYYVFQKNLKLLHPDIQKPDFCNLRIPVPPPSWHALPVFSLDMSPLYNRLKELFDSRQKVNVAEIKSILEELGFPNQFFAKLSGGLLKIDGELATKDYMLDYWIDIWEKLKLKFAKVTNFSEWKNWASGERILNEIAPF